MTQHVVITGGSGYVAQNLRKALGGAPNVTVTCLSRHDAPGCTTVADYTDPQHYQNADVVIHCAAMAHTDNNSRAAVLRFFQANTELPDKLANMLAHLPHGAKGPPRLIFISSLGARTVEQEIALGRRENVLRQKHPYQLSKLYAERALAAYAPRLDITCLRPPLIYGPGAPGNLAKLIALIQRGLPLPTGRATAPRGYCFIGNLFSAIEHLIAHPQKGFHVYEVGDGESISTRTLVAMLGTVYGKTPRQWPIPPSLFRLAMRAIGQLKIYTRLFEPMPVDNDAMKKIGWTPIFTLAEGLAALKTPGIAAPKITL